MLAIAEMHQCKAVMMQTIKAFYLQCIKLLMHLGQLLLLLLQVSLKSGNPTNATLLACSTCTSSVRTVGTERHDRALPHNKQCLRGLTVIWGIN